MPRTYPTFTCSYRFEGREHVIHVVARDSAEVSRRLRAIGTTAKLDGELIAEIPVERPGGWLTTLRRLFGARSGEPG